jgi:hypothetical protein
MRMTTNLWKYNRITGLWNHQRICDESTAQEWLKIFSKDEPAETFVVAKHSPKKPPEPR